MSPFPVGSLSPGRPAKARGRDDGSCSEAAKGGCILPGSGGQSIPLARLLTDHGQRADAAFHRALVLLLQPGALQQPHGGLEKLHHDGLVGLKERAGRYVSVQGASRPCFGGLHELLSSPSHGLSMQPLITCSEVLFSEKGELKNALMVSSTTVSTYFSSVGSGRRFSRFLHIWEEKGGC